VDFLGKISKQFLTPEGQLLDSLEAPSPDGRHVLILDKGTRTVNSKGEVVTLVEVREELMVPPLPSRKKLVGTAYNFEPSGAIFDKPVYLALGYDIDQLPQNVSSVKLAYYSAQSEWVSLEPDGGRVAEVGTAGASVKHFTLFAVLAEESATPTPTTTGTPVEWPKVFMWIFIALFLLIILIWWLLRRYVFRFGSRDRDS
jgi:hypothetical protein